MGVQDGRGISSLPNIGGVVEIAQRGMSRAWATSRTKLIHVCLMLAQEMTEAEARLVRLLEFGRSAAEPFSQ